MTVADLLIEQADSQFLFGECNIPVVYYLNARDCLNCNIFKSTGSDCILISDIPDVCVHVRV